MPARTRPYPEFRKNVYSYLIQEYLDISSSIEKLKKADKQHHDATSRQHQQQKTNADKEPVSPAVNCVQVGIGVDLLATVSGFQSAQYRLIEFSSTDLINLIDYRFRSTIDRKTSYEDALEHLYWQAAGKDYKTNDKSFLLKEFERKYKKTFLSHMEEYNTINIWQKFKQLPSMDQQNPELINAMRHYDFTVNITWVMQHLNTAKKYIEGSGKGDGEATGGSNWKKYMHPKYQRRIFFPELWSQEELDNWGEEK